jgi:two-component system sensor kinase FixL
MEEVSDQARRAGRIIQRLRAFVSKSQPQKSAARIRRLTTEVVDLLAMDIRQNQIDFHLEVPEDLPPVPADRIQVQQVLLNLMRNAIEAMARPGAADRRLTVRASPPANGMVEVAVSDSGPGCPPEALATMFDAFFTTKDSGLGMGLSISKTIVEAHGGRLWATTNPQGGLTFRFTLPTADGGGNEPGLTS